MKEKAKKLVELAEKILYILTKEQKKYGVCIIAASFIAAILETLGVSVIVPLVNVLLTPEALMENEWVKKILDFFNITGTMGITLLIGGGTILVYILKNLYFIFLSWVRAKYSCKVQRELSVHMMQAYMGKGYPFFLTKNTSELMRGVFSDINGLYFIISKLFQTIVEVMIILLIGVFIFVQDLMTAICVTVLATICLLIIYKFLRTRLRNSGKNYRKYKAIVDQSAMQAFQGIKEVIVMRKQKYFTENFEKAYNNQQQAAVQKTVAEESASYVIEGICISGLLGFVCLKIILGGNAREMLPALSALAVGAFRILPALGKISSSINTMIFYAPSLEAVYKHIKESEENKDTIQEIYGNISDSSNKYVGFSDEIKINKICWKYAQGQKNVLEDLSMTIKKGTSVAFVGQSGAGKTTLADIILGLLKPQSGEVTIDGVDIFSMGRNWSKIIGYVPQSVYLTDDSIRKNIAFGVEEKDIDDEKVWHALEQARLKEFVEKLDNKLDTMIGERGVRFSGGQRQRIAIARALYENPNILVLDEATAALDNETEKAVMESIDALQGHKTLIIIAHRITTIKNCDVIYEITEGKAVRKNYNELQK